MAGVGKWWARVTLHGISGLVSQVMSEWLDVVDGRGGGDGRSGLEFMARSRFSSRRIMSEKRRKKQARDHA